jgi:uncharacterized short protein YbdD (DUF466 family)
MTSALRYGVSYLALRLTEHWAGARRTGRLICGIPDYDAYLRHRRERHPSEPALSYEAFFRDRQAARYGSGTSRCC